MHVRSHLPVCQVSVFPVHHCLISKFVDIGVTLCLLSNTVLLCQLSWSARKSQSLECMCVCALDYMRLCVCSPGRAKIKSVSDELNHFLSILRRRLSVFPVFDYSQALFSL